MRTSIFTFASDLHDEGVEPVLDAVEHRAGLDGVTIAAAYHAARDLFPHNPVRKVRFFTEGALYFRPDPGRYAGLRIQPAVSELVRETDILAEACAAAGRRGLQVDAWSVFLHADRPGAYPECATANAFGDRYLTDLCPANPHVRAYARALAADVARYDVTRIVAESLHYHGLEHGYHHERYLIDLAPRARFLLGLCFCEHCLSAARRRGIDGEAVARAARADLERAFEADGGGVADPAAAVDLDRAELGALADGELGGYLETRCETVSTLASEVAEAAEAAGKRLAYVDLSGAVKGYASGRPAGGPAASIGWRFGVDLERLAGACHELEVVAYAANPERVRLDLEAYAERVDRACPIGAALRPAPPDCRSPENLAAKARAARELGLARLDFYHYGLVRLSALDWVRDALS